MIWALLVGVALVAIPLLIERGRSRMDDIVRGAAPGQFAELSRGVTHYEWFGPPGGRVAVCIHGLTTPSFVWRGLTRGLVAMGFRVLVYDLYGRGYSDRPKGPQDQAFFLAQLDDLLDREGADKDITLIGYSMGGAIAACFAARAPDRVRQLILLAPAGMGLATNRLADFIAHTPLIGDWLMLAFNPISFRRGISAERHLPSSVPDIYDQQEAQLDYRGFVPAVLASRRGILSRPLRAEHQAIHAASIPVLAIWGTEDTVIPASAIGTLAEWSRDTHQVVIDGAGHGLTYTHTDEVLSAIKTEISDNG